MGASLTRRQWLIALLADRRGLTARELAAQLGWRAASVRGEISRLKSEGLVISATDTFPKRYTLVAQQQLTPERDTSFKPDRHTGRAAACDGTRDALVEGLERLGLLE